MMDTVVAVAFVFLAWRLVLARWRIRRIESDRAALLLSALMFGTIGLYSLTHGQLDASLILTLVGGAFIQYLFARYVLRVFAADRPPSG
jgi:hypothetical protein